MKILTSKFLYFFLNKLLLCYYAISKLIKNYICKNNDIKFAINKFKINF